MKKPTILPVKKVAYLIVFAIIPLPFFSYQFGAYLNFDWIQAWTVPLFIFVFIPVVDWLVGKDNYNPTVSEDKKLNQSNFYRWITLLVVPLHLSIIFWGASVFAAEEFSLVNNIGWAISCGLISGSIGITLSHELIHKDGKLEPNLGGLMLSSMCYATFKVEHLRGHHVNVSTPRDQSSARKGENIYPFVVRAIAGNVANAWRLEKNRLQRKQKYWLSLNNELIGWSFLSFLFVFISYWIGGWSGVGFFLLQSLVAIVQLEVINFVEHYGLSRRLLDNNRYERVSHKHSWNSSYLVTNIMLFQLQRHSDHHETPKRRYQQLKSYKDSPQLPAGYATMFLLALVPWAWRKIMDPIVDEYVEQDIGQKASAREAA